MIGMDNSMVLIFCSECKGKGENKNGEICSLCQGRKVIWTQKFDQNYGFADDP